MPRKKASVVEPATPETTEVKTPRGRAAQRPFPAQSFEEAMQLALAIQKSAGSNSVRRLTIFNAMGKSPESSMSRTLIIAAGRYGLTSGGVQSEHLQLTPDGDVATSDDVTERERTKARIKLAVNTVEIFKQLYEQFAGQKLPATPILEDNAVAFGVPEHQKKECIETWLVNLRFVGLLNVLSGVERILTTEHALEQISSSSKPAAAGSRTYSRSSDGNGMVVHSDAQFDRLCFFIGPIGDASSEYRQHSDLILEQLVRPVLEDQGFEVKRADEIQESGLITKQIFQYLLKARLVVADLSYHNPNVFYELAIRHARNLPVVQMIRSADRIPFDVNQTRTTTIDTTNLYTFVPKMASYKAEISNHIRRALEDPSSADNPFSALTVEQ